MQTYYSKFPNSGGQVNTHYHEKKGTVELDDITYSYHLRTEKAMRKKVTKSRIVKKYRRMPYLFSFTVPLTIKFLKIKTFAKYH